MPINEGLFIGLDGRTFIRRVHAAVVGYQLASPERPCSTSARPNWMQMAASSSSSHPCLPRPTLVSDLNNPAIQVRTAAKESSPPPPRPQPTPARGGRPNALVHAPQGADGLVTAHLASSGSSLPMR